MAASRSEGVFHQTGFGQAGVGSLWPYFDRNIMEIVQRILGKIVGKELSAEELKLVSGAAPVSCTPPKVQTVFSSGGEKCDNPT